MRPSKQRLKRNSRLETKQEVRQKLRGNIPDKRTEPFVAAKALLKRKIQLEKQLGSTLSMLDKMVHIKGQVENANTQGTHVVDAQRMLAPMRFRCRRHGGCHGTRHRRTSSGTSRAGY